MKTKVEKDVGGLILALPGTRSRLFSDPPPVVNLSLHARLEA